MKNGLKDLWQMEDYLRPTNVNFMNIDITIQKLKKLLIIFLQKEISIDEFKYKFLDIYEYEVEKFIPKSKEEIGLQYLLLDYYSDIRSYSPYKEDHVHGLLNIDQLIEYTNILLIKLKEYDFELGEIILKNKNLNKTIRLNLEKLLYTFNTFFHLKLEEEELINQISYILPRMIPLNEDEKEIVGFINKNLIILKNNLNNRNEFLEVLRNLKIKIYNYLQ